jgi:hypothetical protein
MNNQVLPAGGRVRVISYGPFRGLKGTIRDVDTIPTPEAGEVFCFYLIELEGTHIKNPIWFECDEVELVDCPSSDDGRPGREYRTVIEQQKLF